MNRREYKETLKFELYRGNREMTQCERLIAEGVFKKDFFKEEIKNDFLVDTTRKKIWAIEIDLLLQLDRICKKYNLCYYLMFGTLLGAIRHNGFIPWDDDVDVCMPRRDYEKLLKVAPSELQHPYFFQTPETDEGYYYTFARIRNSETAAFLPLYQYQKFNMGLLLDIFPVDVYCENDAQKNFDLIQNLTCENTTYMRMTNPHLSEKDIERVKQYKGGSPKERYDLIQKTAMKHEKEADNFNKRVVAVFTGCALSKMVFYASDLSETVLHSFEGFEFPIPAGWDRILRATYGDYHQFPPVEQRGTWHSDYIIDPDKSYKEFYAPDVDCSQNDLVGGMS